MPERVLILGGAGMLGHRLLLALRGGWEVWATVRRPLGEYDRYGVFDRARTIEGVDVTNIQSVIDTIAVVRPTVVINCVGIIKQLPTARERLLSLTVNSVLPHRLQRLCQACGARLIHFSTDCVFRGDKGMYTEDDPSDATDLYGRTKFLGETAGAGALTLRTSIIGRELDTRSGLVEWFLAQRGKRVQGFTRAIYSGFTTHSLARILRTIIADHRELSGTVQVASEPIAKHDLLELIRRAYHVDIEIVPEAAPCVDRSLDGSRFQRATGFVPPSWPAMIEEMAADPTPYKTNGGRMFTGKTLLITGGTGTFGNAVLRRFLKTQIAEIRVVSRDEKKQEDMRLAYQDSKLKFYIGDVRDYDSVAPALDGADYVFHAAALKQVPSCEFYPLEALRTNALGAENVMNAAMNMGVERMIVFSTDKSVYPINAMGISKAMMEKLMVAKARLSKRGGTILCGTRYGNVMGSRGSVIPLFIRQVTEGRPLTVTDPAMTRFMMSIDDAVDLVLFAFEHGRPGDIFVQKAPAATIETLAIAIKRLFEAPNPIQVIGTRHGEKLFETLLTREERVKAEDMGSYFRVPADNRDLNYNVYFAEGQEILSHEEDYHSHNTRRLDVDGLMEVLQKADFVRLELDAWQRRVRASAGA